MTHVPTTSPACAANETTHAADATNNLAALELSDTEFDELETFFVQLNQDNPSVPPWEFVDGLFTALACTRRPVSSAEWFPTLVGDGTTMAEHEPLPLVEPFESLAQQNRFVQLCEKRRTQIAAQLALPVDSLDEENAFYPEAVDMRGAIACLEYEEQAKKSAQEPATTSATEPTQSDASSEEPSDDPIPALGQVWALGFLFAVDFWQEEWAAPRDKEGASLLQELLQTIEVLAEDDHAAPVTCLFDENGPPSVSQERIERFGDAVWAVYDLHQFWHSLGPRVVPHTRPATPGRNDPCWCGSGKKFKKCHGA